MAYFVEAFHRIGIIYGFALYHRIHVDPCFAQLLHPLVTLQKRHALRVDMDEAIAESLVSIVQCVGP